MKKTYLSFIFLSLITVILAGCSTQGWHLRNAEKVPPQLNLIYLDPDGASGRFITELTHQLQSIGISLTAQPQAAPLILRIYQYSFVHNNPALSTTNVGITYTYTLSFMIEIIDNANKVIVPPFFISTSRDITINTNQIFTINSSTLFQQELQRDSINLVYYWLTDNNTRRLLMSYQEQKHAAQSQATAPTS